MPWKEMKIVEQRVEFIRAVERDEHSFSTLCERFGISRKTGYKWLKPYRDFEDVEGLRDQSRAPLGRLKGQHHRFAMSCAS